MNHQFLAASEQHFAPMWTLEQQCHRFPWSETNLRSCLSGSYWGEVLQVDGQLIGFYLFQQVLDELTLVNICVSPALQGQGYGTLLLEQAIEQAIAKQGSICFLEVRASNQAAIALYDKVGFVEYSVRPDYYPSEQGREDAVLMSMMLTF